jgi:hypothetical protein
MSTKRQESGGRAFGFLRISRKLLFGLLFSISLLIVGFSLWPKKDYVTFREAVESIASKKNLAVLPEPEDAKELTIISAHYGAKERWIDVTEQVRKQVHENQLSIYASNRIAGDPLEGYPKQLRVEYTLDGVKARVQIREGGKLRLPPQPDPYDALGVIETAEELVTLAKKCPAEVGFYGINFTSGKTIEYRGEQPACMASIVKIFVLLEVMRQAEEEGLNLAEPIVIERGSERETCSIAEAVDKMIGISDNDATNTLARKVGYNKINMLAKELGIGGLTDQLLPEPGVLEGVLDQRVYKIHVVPKNELLSQHGTAKCIVRYFEFLHKKELISEPISAKVLEAMERNPKYFAPGATPWECRSVGKGGSLSWKRPFRPEYNMVGWGLYIYDESEAMAFCLWFEWFPEQMAEGQRLEWASGISDCIVGLLLRKKVEGDSF